MSFSRTIGGLLEVGHLVARFRRLRLLRGQARAYRRDLLRQRLGPVLRLLQGFSQRCGGAFSELFFSHGFLARLGRLRNIGSRIGQIALQLGSPLPLLAQGFLQLRDSFRCLLEISGLVAGLTRLTLILRQSGARGRDLLRQRLGLVVLLQ